MIELSLESGSEKYGACGDAVLMESLAELAPSGRKLRKAFLTSQGRTGKSPALFSYPVQR